MLDRRQLFEHIDVLSVLSVLGQPLNCLYGLHVCRLGVVKRDSTLAVAPITSDASRHKRVKGAAKLIVQILQVSQRIENAIVAIGLTHRLAPILITFHPILGLIGTFGLSIELPYADQVESVGEQLRLDLHVELAVARQARRQINLNQPGFEVAVNHYIKAVDFETVGAMNAGLFAGGEYCVFG